jgi:superkiller protein 3
MSHVDEVGGADRQDPIVWANLGYLYLKLDDRELANQCFLKAQTMDPDHAPAWLGQAMLADRNGDKEHARGLFVHSVTLSGGSLVSSPVQNHEMPLMC